MWPRRFRGISTYTLLLCAIIYNITTFLLPWCCLESKRLHKYKHTFAQAWLDICTHSHTLCKQPSVNTVWAIIAKVDWRTKGGYGNDSGGGRGIIFTWHMPSPCEALSSMDLSVYITDNWTVLSSAAAAQSEYGQYHLVFSNLQTHSCRIMSLGCTHLSIIIHKTEWSSPRSHCLISKGLTENSIFLY